MIRLTRLLPLLAALAAQACVSSTLVLHVMADGSGHAVIASRIFEPGLKAFDAMFPESPKELPTLEESLPVPSDGGLGLAFGSPVRMASTKLDRTADGGVRTTVVDFDDITRIRLGFPPIFSLPAGSHFDMLGFTGTPVITFAVKPHENGDRLLLVRMPDERLDTRGDEPITSFENDSARELLFKRAIRGSALRLFVELDEPLLRTNAPDRKGNRATIFDFDLDKMINAMDASKVRRMMSPGSLQEMLWQVGDLPGAIVSVDREIFLEYEPAQATPPPPAAPASPAQAPPDTEIYLAPLKNVNGVLEVGPAIDISNNPGYDNQPFFTPDGRGVLFTSVRGPGVTQTDIYRYDIAARQISQVTATPESEYSPTITPAGNLSVVRVELDADKTQRLWQFTADGRDPRVLVETIKPVGYHAWADAQSLALFVLGPPATLQLVDPRSGTAATLATDIGRSLQRIPVPARAAAGTATISFVQRERTRDGVSLVIKELNPSTRAISVLTPAVAGSTEADCAWTPDGTLLMVKGATLYGWRRGQSGWKEVASLQRLSLAGVSRLAVSPQGDYLALVGPPRQPH
jgi:WD40-like Beta Propeller Repeat